MCFKTNRLKHFTYEILPLGSNTAICLGSLHNSHTSAKYQGHKQDRQVSRPTADEQNHTERMTCSLNSKVDRHCLGGAYIKQA